MSGELEREVLRLTAESGQTALKAIMWINGGAAIALLAFVGQIVSRDGASVDNATELADAFKAFIAGVLVACLGYGTTYLSNLTQSVGWRIFGIILLGVTVLLWIGAVVAFGVGAWGAATAFVPLLQSGAP